MTGDVGSVGPRDVAPEVLEDLATAHGACIRPVLTWRTDHLTGDRKLIPIACGATRASRCPSCAERNRLLRMQQCREGWHRDHEPDNGEADEDDEEPGAAEDDEDHEDLDGDDEERPARRVRSTRRRQDVADLPRVPMNSGTVGRSFTAPNGITYRPSMFLTLTLPSYGPVRDDGTPIDPDTYDYHRAALDALHFSRLVDRFWQNLRRCAGYRVQYFAAVESQQRLAGHLHAAVRGTVPRSIVRQVVRATYHQVWWPDMHTPVYAEEAMPVWDEDVGGFVDPETGTVLPTWDEALDAVDVACEADPATRPAHVVRFGTQIDYQGILASNTDQVNRAVGYLTKYLAKDIAQPSADAESITARQVAHLDRLHHETSRLPCSPTCANWLRYGTQPRDAGPHLTPGHCGAKAHDREHLGLGGRRVLVSRDWSGKTLRTHRADRADIVRATLTEAGIDPDQHGTPEEQTPAGAPRYTWAPVDPSRDDLPPHRVILGQVVSQRIRWRQQYQAAKTRERVSPQPVSHPAIVDLPEYERGRTGS